MFDSIVLFGARHRIPALLIVIALTVLTGIGASNIRVDTTFDALIDPNDPDKIVYDEVVERFGSDYMTMVYVKDPNLFTPEKLAKLEDLHYAFDGLDFVEKVDSIFTIANIRNVDGDLDTTPLMDGVPETREEIDDILATAQKNPFAVKYVLGNNGTAAVINIKIRPDWGDPELAKHAYESVEELLDPARGDFAEVFQIGPPAMMEVAEQCIDKDLRRLPLIVACLLVLGMTIFLRSPSVSFLPLVTAGLSIVWTFGALGYLNVPLNMLSSGLPLFLIAVGSTEDTHMIGTYLRGLMAEGDETVPVRHRAVDFMMRKVGVATVVTAATTAIGFGSSAIGSIQVLVDFGIATSLGMVFNLIATVLVVPMALKTFGPKTCRTMSQDNRPTGIFLAIYCWSVKVTEDYRRSAILVAIAISVIGVTLGLTIKQDNNMMRYFKPDNPVVLTADIMHRDVAGIHSFFVELDGGRPDYFIQPENMKKVAAIQKAIADTGKFDNVLSIADHVSFVNREMTTGKQDMYSVPDDRNLIEQYLLFFQCSDMSSFIDQSHRYAAIIVRHNITKSADVAAGVADVSAIVEKISDGDFQYHVVSQGVLMDRVSAELVRNQILSFGIVALVIFSLVSLMYSSLALGLVSLIPNVIPAFVVFGAMALLDIPLNPGTVLVIVVALGIAVDDTFHLMTSYSQVARVERDTRIAVRKVVSTQVVAVVTTSISLGASFLVFVFSQFNVVAQFGVLSAIALTAAVLADLVITPIFLRYVRLVSIWDVIALDIGVDALKESPLFEGMSSYQIRKVISLCEVVDYEEGAAVVQQGQEDANMYVLLSGKAGVVRIDEGGVEHFVSALLSGDVFGEVGFTGAATRTADVRALTGVKVLRISADDTATSLRLYPRIADKLYRNIAAILGKRLHHALRTLGTEHA